MNSIEFLDAVCAARGIKSNRKLADSLGIQRANIVGIRAGRRTLTPTDCHAVAAALGEPVEYVLAEIQAERAKRTEDRAAWRRLAALAKKHVAAAVLLALTAGAALTPHQARAASFDDPEIYIMRNSRRRALAALLGALRRLGARSGPDRVNVTLAAA